MRILAQTKAHKHGHRSRPNKLDCVPPPMGAGSDNIAQQQVSPHTNCYLVPGLSFEGGIFKEQQTTFLTHLILPNLADVQWTATNDISYSRALKSITDRAQTSQPRGPQGGNCGCLGGPQG